MLRSLHAKLSLVLLALFVPVGALYVWSTVATSQRYAQEVRQTVDAGLAQRLVQEHALMVRSDVDPDALADIVKTLAMTNPGVDLYVLDPTGAILRSSVPSDKLAKRRVSLAPIEAFLRPGASFPIRGDNPRADGRSKVFSVAPIPAGGAATTSSTSARPPATTEPLDGYLYIVLADELHDSVAAMVADSTIVRLAVWVGLAGLALVFLAGILIFTLFTRRLNRLASAMARFEASDFTADTLSRGPAPRPGDEVAEVERVFHGMAERMAEQLRALKENDRLRRELVANVSHDLRTPLTALQGYLETMQLETATDAEKRAYLAIATKHSLRLGRLVDELFELAKLDANATRPQPEDFPLAELVQDVVAELQITAKRKGVNLSTDVHTHPFVHADVALLQRVLQNLLANALHHTPPKGSVTVALYPTEGGVRVAVTDTGSGIPPEELPHVFERYYRVPRTERPRRTGRAATDTVTDTDSVIEAATGDATDDATGAGLGLAISERMLELHGVRLHATSKVGDGSTFWFELPTVAPDKGPRTSVP